MKISYNWLGQYINVEHSPEETAKLLTDCGLEVEAIETWQSVKGGLQGIVVGEVKESVKHPGADRLSICKVDTGDGVLKQIVCGASNVAAGQKVAVALPGAILHPSSGAPFEIKKSKIRGEASEGMICAEDEIGLGASHEGIMVLDSTAVPGQPASEYFKIASDHVFEIGLTPNRADAASHIGVARDLQAVYSLNGNTKLKKPDVSGFKESTAKNPVEVVIKDDDCIRYSGLYINNLKVKDSPEWLQIRLKAVGIRPVNNVVDVTNFVMMECGQPMHAFDAAKIKGNRIIVQKLPSGTVFKTLDGVDRVLKGSELMICNDEEGMCIAGVFGGLDSGVNNNTQAIFLESACFSPGSIRNASKIQSLHTDSSFRFERGTDPDATVNALKRAALLLAETAGGKAASQITDIYKNPVKPFPVRLDLTYLERLAGGKIDIKITERILESLEIKVVSQTGDFLELLVPPFKTDVTRPADVVEEILRIYGYNNIPLPEKINSSMPDSGLNDSTHITKVISDYLVGAGFDEIINNSLTKSQYIYDDTAVKILNPLSAELSVLRQSMLFSGLETISYNSNRQQEHFSLFESGRIYSKSKDTYHESQVLGLWLAGKRYRDNWQQLNRPYDFYYMKSVIKNILAVSDIKVKIDFIKEEIPHLQHSVSIMAGGKKVASAGNVSSKTLKEKTDLSIPVFYAEIYLDELRLLQPSASFTAREPNRFPEVKRDLSMVLDASVEYKKVEAVAYETESRLLKQINLFDIYEGEKIGTGKKSIALTFVLYNEEATLQEKQIDSVMDKLMKNFEKQLGAVIRKH